jgi:phage major head subunit gpT-like protein
MASVVSKAGFPDVLDPRFREVTYQTFKLQKDMIPFFYTQEASTQFVERGTDITPMGDLDEFGGTIDYDAPTQGYDWTATHKEYAKGIQVERVLWEFDQFGVIDDMFSELSNSAFRSRQKDAARFFNRGFSDDTTFFDGTEDVALFNGSHTTPRDGVSTAAGFSNRGTSALSPTALGTAITNFRKLKDLAGERINVMPNLLVVPVDLRDRALEIVKTEKGLDTAEGTVNVYNSEYNFQVVDWIYLTDTNNWFLLDSVLMKKALKWYEKVKPEFARVEAFDEIIAKYRVYCMYTMSRSSIWQFGYGQEVS